MTSQQMPARFDDAYHETAYRDYLRQNPIRKLALYESIVQQARYRQPPTLIDRGCGLGVFLSTCVQEIQPNNPGG